MKNKSLSSRGTAMFRAIIAYKLEHDGCSPALTDLMQACEIRSKSTASRYLTALEDAKLIRNAKGMHARGIEVVGGSWAWKPPEAQKRERPRKTTETPGARGIMQCPVCKQWIEGDEYWDGSMCLRCALAQEQKNGHMKGEER